MHKKDFKFYKQHAVSHVIEDIEQKGTTNNFSTRPGEGFLQEVKEAYGQTNNKNADVQVFMTGQMASILCTEHDVLSDGENQREPGSNCSHSDANQ